MPTEKEFETALDNIANYVRNLDNKVLTEKPQLIQYEDRNGETYEFTGYSCLHDNTEYLIVGNPNFQFMSILHFVNVHNSIADDLSDEEVRGIINRDEQNKDSTEKVMAADKLLHQANTEEMEAARSYIYTRLSGENYLTEIQSTGTGAVTYILLESKIFPYDDIFGIRELYNSITTIVSAGEKAGNLVSQTIDITKLNDNSGGYKLTFTPSR